MMKMKMKKNLKNKWLNNKKMIYFLKLQKKETLKKLAIC